MENKIRYFKLAFKLKNVKGCETLKWPDKSKYLAGIKNAVRVKYLLNIPHQVQL